MTARVFSISLPSKADLKKGLTSWKENLLMKKLSTTTMTTAAHTGTCLNTSTMAMATTMGQTEATSCLK